MDNPHNLRREIRQALSLHARCRTQGGMRDHATLSDISAHGCCVTVTNLFLMVGMRLMIKPDGMEAISGMVRWLKGRQAGVEFDSSLYVPVVDHLARVAAHPATVDVSQADAD